MVLKVSAFDSKLLQQDDLKKQSTDLIHFLCKKPSQRIHLSMIRFPEVFVFPTSRHNGILRVNKSKRVPLQKNGHFFYGAWPQTRVSPVKTKKLNELLHAGKIRCDGFYYTLGGKPCQEYKSDDRKLYVLIHDTGVWFETKPIEWVYDSKLGCAYTYKALWNSNELSAKQLDTFGWQVMQCNKQMNRIQERLLQKQTNLDLRDIEADVLRTVRFLRDKEKEQGIVEGKGRKMYNLLKCQFYKSKQRG